MKRIKRSPERFEVLDLFARLSRDRNLDITKDSVPRDFASLLGAALKDIRSNQIAIHGRRIQEMFAYVAASLGTTTFIKLEDSGDVITSESGLAIPDYRLVLIDKSQLLIEVKNNHTSDPKEPLRLCANYLASLRRYGDLMAAPVFLAVYWSRWNLWTLASVDQIPPAGLTLLSAVLRNQMYRLGDQFVGTTPPLVLRMLADTSVPRRRDRNGFCNFRIGAVDFLCAGTKITDPTERAIAYQLMILGKWPEADSDVRLDGEDLVHIDMIFAPEEQDPSQHFQIIGDLSSMISRRFQLITTKERAVTSLSPSAEPGSLAVPIPADYKGTALPLWRLVVSPKETGGA